MMEMRLEMPLNVSKQILYSELLQEFQKKVREVKKMFIISELKMTRRKPFHTYKLINLL